MIDSNTIKKIGFDIGFDLIETTTLTKSQYRAHVEQWVAQQHHGSMQWYERSMDRRVDPQKHLYGKAVTAITVGMYYRPPELDESVTSDPSRGIIARYALYPDYHRMLEQMLKKLAREITTCVHGAWEYRIYVDTGPLLEREIGAKAAMGFIGKNTTLINTTLGSYFFLGEIVCDLDIANTATQSIHERFGKAADVVGGCGSCTRCQDACPTDAFTAPYTLDARKCISYLTIENRGSVPLELRPLMKNRIYGCDICQEVCPWNKKSRDLFTSQFTPSVELAPHLLDLVSLDENGFKNAYKGTPILRAKREGFIRNVLVAIGNWGSSDARSYVAPLVHDESALVAEHATWALARIGD